MNLNHSVEDEMDKENLEKKFAELLGLNENESVFAFNKFKEKIVDSIFVGDALKIKGLGVFQIKEQLSEEINKTKNRKKTLLFSPASEISVESSPFLTLDIQQKFTDTVEFDEKIFQLGIGKPMISLEDDGSKDTSDVRAQQIETKIDELIQQSEKISNYDIWEDYFEGKEAQSIFNEDEINDELDSYFDDDIDLKSKQLFENDFEELNDDEILNNIFEDGSLDNEEINELTSNEKIDEETDDMEDEILENDLLDNVEKTKLDEFEDHDENNKENIQIIGEKFPNLENRFSLTDNNINNPISEEFETEKTNENQANNVNSFELIENDQNENEENNFDQDLADKKLDVIVEENTYNLDLENKQQDEKDMKKEISRRKKNKVTVRILIGMFVIVSAIGIYYLFLKNPTWLYDQHEIEAQMAEQNAKMLKEINDKLHKQNEILNNKVEAKTPTDSTAATFADVKNDTVLQAKNVIKNEISKSSENEVKKDEVKLADNKTNNIKPALNEQITNKEKPKETAKTESKVKLTENDSKTVTVKKETQQKEATKTIVKEMNQKEEEVSNNIYSDGKNYSVQISSWKQQSIAKREANKLKSRGFDAYVIKVFIQKLNGTWHRVRIGPYSTLEEAQKNQSKL